MFTNLSVFRTAHALASHAGQRQAIIAENIANADTPGYAARDIAPFQDLLRPDRNGNTLKRTRAGHLQAVSQTTHRAGSAEANLADPNGNAVVVETEMLKSVETMRQHDRALAIYRSSLAILRGALAR